MMKRLFMKTLLNRWSGVAISKTDKFEQESSLMELLRKEVNMLIIYQNKLFKSWCALKRRKNKS